MNSASGTENPLKRVATYLNVVYHVSQRGCECIRRFANSGSVVQKEHLLNPDLYAFVLRLRPERDGPLPEVLGHQAQGLFFELVRQIDPDLANALHADAQSKPFTVAILEPRTETREPRTENRERSARQLPPFDTAQDKPANRQLPTLDLRVTLMDARLFAPFTRSLLEQTARPTMRLGRAALLLGDVCGTPMSHQWAGYDSFAALAERARPALRATLLFATPAAVGQGVRANGKPRHALLPTPEVVFGSLGRRWNELCPEDLRLPSEEIEAACRETLVSQARVETRQFSLGRAIQKGFVGQCTYELPLDQPQARLLSLLADAAFYLGIGIKTGRGMGIVRRMRDEG